MVQVVEVLSMDVFLLRNPSLLTFKEMEETGPVGHKCPILVNNEEVTSQSMSF